MMREKSRYVICFCLMGAMLIFLIWMNLASGSSVIGTQEIISILAGDRSDITHYNIVFSIRLPRTVCAILLGGALALSGYLLQTFFANPIVGPYVLGISSGAKLCVALAMIFLLKKGYEIGPDLMVVSAFIGALLAMLFVLAVSVKVRSMSALVICGIMTGYICSALCDLIITFADDTDIVNLHNWSLGSLAGVNWEEIRIMAVIILSGLFLSVMISKQVNAYRMGEAYALSVGVNITLLRVMLILLSSLLAACVTAFAGPVSFVGVALPHLMRNLFKTDKALLMIPACFLGGAVVTLLCDMISRTMFAPVEVSISSVTAVLLVPVVIVMLIKRNSDRSMSL